MGKSSDMAIARKVCRENLTHVEVANPVGVAVDPKKMAASIALAALAKQKTGVGSAAISATSKEYILEQGKAVLQAHAARCDQFGAAVCYLLTQQPGFKSSIELLGNGKYANGTHCWVLCGRNQSGDISQVASWGDKAFTIDVWLAKQHGISPVIEFPMQHKWNTDHATKIVILQSWAGVVTRPRAATF